MSFRSHSVVVDPGRWPGETDELARLLAPVAGAAADALARVLARGPMTVEADLSSEDAEHLRTRLTTLGIPATIVPEDDDLDESGDWGLVNMPGMGGAESSVAADAVEDGRRQTMMGMNPMSDSGWGALFPDLEPDEPDEPALPPSLDDLAGDEQPAAAATKPAARAASGPPSLPKQGTPTTPARPATPRTPATTKTEAAAAPKPAAAPSPTPRPSSSDSGASRSQKSFDPTKLTGLMPAGETERAPYAPTGFDPRPEHHPPFALALSVIAPGAGQVFNGNDDDALAYGLRFFLIKPWIDSARSAYQRAEEIRTYYAPQPAEGNMGRAIRYALGWWAGVLCLAALLYWIGGATYDMAMRERAPEGPTVVEVERSFSNAEMKVLGARVAALDALQAASVDLKPEAQFSMSDTERADRLFAIGYAECSGRRYRMCEQVMRRVAELKPAFPGALRLQAWASLQLRGGDAKMPEVDAAPSLDEYELQLYRQQMANEGENVPPIPDVAEPDEPAEPPARDAVPPPSDD